MSMDLFKQAYEGSVIATGYAQIRLNQAIAEYGKDHKAAYPGTAYYLPVMMALEGTKVETLGQLVPIFNEVKSACIKADYTLEGAKNNGKATLFAAEIIEVCNYLDQEPYHPPWTGFVPDTVMRALGIKLVDLTIPGFAIILGKAKDNKTAVEIFRNLQSKGILAVLCNEIIEQLLDEGVKLGYDALAVPLGNFTQIIHIVNFALRAGLAFGGVPAGETDKHVEYQTKRIKAFVLALGNQDNVRIAASSGAFYLGHPTITDQPLKDGNIPDTYIYEPDPKKMVALGIELRDIKIKALDLDLPILMGPAFEGESVRRADLQVEFGGKYSTAFEWLTMVGVDDIDDGKVTLTGPDIDKAEVGGAMPLGIKVKVYGRKMQADFESVLERRLHECINFGEGLLHQGQRDIVWLRVNKKAYEAGFRLKHVGEMICAKLKADFAIADRVEVQLFTDQAAVDKELANARKVFAARDERIRGLTDEKVDTFYSCKLCQSFAPNHLCIVTPERLGLCGAVNWLDARATCEIDPNGPCGAIERGTPTDPVKGIFPNVNAYLQNASNKQINEVAVYGFMDLPMTSCGCFEAILALFPEGNGVMITTRDFPGMTPCGMTFSTLAGSVGGGAQTPGFMGFGRQYINSKKFISGEGGIARIVWMPKELKEFLREGFVARSVEDGLGADFIDKIADEDVGHESEPIMAHLTKMGHPALKMDPLM